MADLLIKHLALVSETSSVPLGEVARVSAALQKQVTRDFADIWSVSATVDAFEKLEDVPLGYWPMIIRDDIGFNAAGIHLDKDGQPYALIRTSNDWSLTASHETLEMLADPFGDRLVAGDSPKPTQGRVEFLVEVSDPSEASQFGYTINGIRVSDFYTPHYFDPVTAPGVRYSFTGAITEPRDVLRGGYVSFHEPVTDVWWQETWFSGDHSIFRSLGTLSRANGSFRSQIDRRTSEASATAMETGVTTEGASLTAAAITESTVSKASSWRAQIEAVLKQASPTTESTESTRRRPPGRR